MLNALALIISANYKSLLQKYKAAFSIAQSPPVFSGWAFCIDF